MSIEISTAVPKGLDSSAKSVNEHTEISTITKHYRYPGPNSFTDDETDSRIFFGRDTEVTELLNRLLSNKLLVMYAKSGLGKTSLLQAGLFPKLRDRDFLPIRLRYNHRDIDLIEELQLAVSKVCKEHDIVFSEEGGKTYWEFFQTALFSKDGHFLTPALILDQFEEIFTLQTEAFRNRLGEELCFLVSGQMPDSTRERIRKGEIARFSSKAPNVRLLISLREDSVGSLQELSQFLPGILSQRFRLTQLNRERARKAIVNPAKLADGDLSFISRPFSFQLTRGNQADTVDAMLDYLQDKHGNIEPFQLQLLCRHIELKVIENQKRSMVPVVVDLQSYLGGPEGMDQVINRFYQNAILALSGWRVRRKARFLCETGLINLEGRRESLSRSQIRQRFELSEKILNELVDKKVLRREERLDNYAYELSHDSLAQAVFNSRRSKIKLKWLSSFVLGVGLFAGVAFWQWMQTQHVQSTANANLEAYKQQVIELVDLGKIKEPIMKPLAGGRFQMGSKDGPSDEQPLHEVTLRSFSMGVYEITFEEYDQFAATSEGHALPDDRGWGRGKRPVIDVSWEDAFAYADWLSKKTGKHYRLPTEAEWEYAVRAGSVGDYHWGDQSLAEEFAWFAVNSGGKTYPVGEKKPNAFGLHDMSGNVWEWVQDCWHDDYQHAPADGSPWEEQNNGNCSFRVLRGGSWYGRSGNLRSADRLRDIPDGRDDGIGFRLARD